MMLIVARGLIQKMDDTRSTSIQHAPVMLMTAIDDGSITQAKKNRSSEVVEMNGGGENLGALWHCH
jgi:hypothetical protein